MAPDTLKEIRLPSDPGSAARARAEVRDWLGEEHPAYEPVRLAVSELVTNAVRHARHKVADNMGGTGTAGGTEHAGSTELGFPDKACIEPVTLRLSVGGDRLRIDVTDSGLTVGSPRLRVDPAFLLTESIPADPAFLLAEGGRGLAIVDMLSEGNWGFHLNPDGPGRTVWCEIATKQPERDSPSDDTSTILGPGPLLLDMSPSSHLG
ncbi:ATP-binding protein [Sphaerisporangium sp. NBC_01403]|uniref:ATP-binding protein n=1 Tax=Sphaerisporangium sp. NBC_01403 TaxID=2903599 RepID=UPI0032520A99